MKAGSSSGAKGKGARELAAARGDVSGSVDDDESYTFTNTTGQGAFYYAEARLQDNSPCVQYTLTTQ